MRSNDETLRHVREADVVLALAGRERPHGYRSSLDSSRRGARELPQEKIDRALAVVARVELIEDPAARRVLALASATERGQPMFKREDISRRLGKSEKTISRLLAKAIAAIRHDIERIICAA